MMKLAVALAIVAILGFCLVVWTLHRIEERRQLGPEFTGLPRRERRAALKKLRLDKESQRELERQQAISDQFDLRPKRNLF